LHLTKLAILHPFETFPGRNTVSNELRMAPNVSRQESISESEVGALFKGHPGGALRSPSENFLRNASEFLRISDTSAASIREYLGGGARGPNLD